MRRRICILLFSTLLLTVACDPLQRQRTAAVLDDIESYINERPDSALAVLDILDTKMIRRPKTQAHYRLLRGIALDKNYRDDGVFMAEMAEAAIWYASHGNDYDRMRAYYYLADQQQDGGRPVEASVNYSRALDLAKKHEWWFIAGMAARNLSSLYLSGYDYPQSVLFARESVNAFEAAGKPQHVLYSRLLLANGYYNTREFGKSIVLCDSLIQAASDIGAADIIADALSISAKAYINQEPPMQDSTLARFNRIKEHTPLSASQLAIYAWALCLNGKVSPAKETILEAYSISKTEKDSTRVMPWDARIAEKTGDISRSNHLFQFMLEYVDRQFHQSFLQSVEKGRAQYYQEEKNYLSEQNRKERMVLFSVIFAIGLLALGVFTILRIQAIRAGMALREQQIRLEEKERVNAVLSDKLALYGTTVEETLDFGFDVLNRLSDAYYHPNTAREAVFREIIKDYVSDVSSRSRLGDSIETNINIIHDDVLTKLRVEIPSLRDEDVKLFSLCLFGFSYKAINAFYPKSSSISASYSRVSRLRKTIEKSGSEYADFFLSFLRREVLK